VEVDKSADPAVISSGFFGPLGRSGCQALLPLSALAATLIQPRNEALLREAALLPSSIDHVSVLEIFSLAELQEKHRIFTTIFWTAKPLLSHKIYPVACQPRPSHLPTSKIRQLSYATRRFFARAKQTWIQAKAPFSKPMRSQRATWNQARLRLS